MVLLEESIAKQSHALHTCVTHLNRWDQMLSEKDFYFTSLYQEKNDDEIKYGSLHIGCSNGLLGNNTGRSDHLASEVCGDTEIISSVLILLTKFESNVTNFMENVQSMYNEVIILQNNSIDTERTILDLTETISLKEANIQQFISRQADSESNNFLSNLQASVQFESVKKTHSKLNKVISEKILNK